MRWQVARRCDLRPRRLPFRSVDVDLDKAGRFAGRDPDVGDRVVASEPRGGFVRVVGRVVDASLSQRMLADSTIGLAARASSVVDDMQR